MQCIFKAQTSNRADVYSLQCLPSDGWTRCSNPVFKIICARRILAKLITQTSGLDNCTQTTSTTDDELICPITHKTSADGVDAYGDHSLTIDVSNSRTKLWHELKGVFVFSILTEFGLDLGVRFPRSEKFLIN